MTPSLDYAPRPPVRRQRLLRTLLVLLILASTSATILIIRSRLAKPVAAPKTVLFSPFTLDYRKPVFDGPWNNFRPDSPDLDPSQRNGGWTKLDRWPPLMLPQGINNVALNKPVSTSAKLMTGKPSCITDGNIDEMHDGAGLDVGHGLQWVQIDLQSRYQIYAIVLWRPLAEGYPYEDVIVQLSDDPLFQKGVTTVFNNDRDNSAGLGAGKDWEYVEFDLIGKLIQTREIKARYLRAYSAGSRHYAVNRYAEIQVFGLP